MTRAVNQEAKVKESQETRCMLCLNCRTFAQKRDGAPTYLKVRCVRGRWQGAVGRPRTHHVYRVRYLIARDCPEFESALSDGQDPAEAVRQMCATLPETRVVCGGGR